MSSSRVSNQRQQAELEAAAKPALKQRHRKSRDRAAAVSAELTAVAGPTGSSQQTSFFSHRQSCLIYGSSLAAAETEKYSLAFLIFINTFNISLLLQMVLSLFLILFLIRFIESI